MAVWSHSPGGVVDAMESAIALRAPSDLRDKIFHLETRIESVEDVPRRETEASSESKLVLGTDPALEDDAHRRRAAEMQMWWDEAIGRNFDLPDGYAKVAVLLIKWDDELDELKTRAEVRVGSSVTLVCISPQQATTARHISSFPTSPNDCFLEYRPLWF